MGKEERKKQFADRDAEICAAYAADPNLAACGKQFNLTRARIQQILKKAGVWHPYNRTPRTEFLGVSVKETTKKALKEKAEAEGVSVSKFASDALDSLVKTV